MKQVGNKQTLSHTSPWHPHCCSATGIKSSYRICFRALKILSGVLLSQNVFENLPGEAHGLDRDNIESSDSSSDLQRIWLAH